jgi:dolichol-phosphate mannosyltransferase
VSEQPIPADANDFRLLDRRVYESVRDMDERNRFLRGLVAWSGFRSIGVEYDRPDRYAGKSKAYSLLVMELALRAILAHTLKPLAVAPILGSGLSLAGIATLLSVFATWVAGSPVQLTGVVVGCSLLVSGVLFALVGVIGMYVGLIYEQVRGRPNFVVRNLIGIESPQS